MNVYFVYFFDSRLKRVRRIKDPSERNRALDRLAQDLGKLRKRHRPSRWDAVFETISPLSEVKEQAQLLRSLTSQSKYLDPDDVHARLDRIEKRARSFGTEFYYRSAFGFLVQDGITALSGQRAVDRFDQYGEEMERDLQQNPEVLGDATCTLAEVIPGLDESKRTAHYDVLYDLMVKHLSRHMDPYVDYFLKLAFANALSGLQMALQSLPDQDVVGLQLDVNGQMVDSRLANLRKQTDRLPHDHMRRGRLRSLDEIEAKILERWQTEPTETPVSRFRIRNWTPRKASGRIRWHRR
jgi:hypothetical protein